MQINITQYNQPDPETKTSVTPLQYLSCECGALLWSLHFHSKCFRCHHLPKMKKKKIHSRIRTRKTTSFISSGVTHVHWVLPYPWHLTFLFSCLYIYTIPIHTVFTYKINYWLDSAHEGKHIPFWNCVTLLNIIHSKSIHFLQIL